MVETGFQSLTPGTDPIRVVGPPRNRQVAVRQLDLCTFSPASRFWFNAIVSPLPPHSFDRNVMVDNSDKRA